MFCVLEVAILVGRRSGSCAASPVSNDVLDELHQLGSNLLRDELITLVVGVNAVARQHAVGEAGGPRTVGNDDGRFRRGVRLHPAGDGCVNAFDGRITPACRDQFVHLEDVRQQTNARETERVVR